MRPAALVAVLLLASPGKLLEVRIKSKHDKVTAEGSGGEFIKLGAEETLRGATIGPGPVRVWLLRLAAPSAKPLTVTITRDGREVAQVPMAAKGVHAIQGEKLLASAPVEQLVDIPNGPHTLFVEAGPGQGHILVTFDERVATAAIARKAAASPAVAAAAPSIQTPEPAAAQVPASRAANKVPVARAAEKKPEGARIASAEKKPAPKAPTATAAKPVVAQAQAQAKIAKPNAAPSKPAAMPPPSGVAVANQPAAASPTAAVASSAPAAVKRVEVPQGPRRRQFLAGVRAGAAGQSQVAAISPALGFTVRYRAWGTFEPSVQKGLLVGLSVDYLSYRLALSVGGVQASSAFQQELILTSVPMLVEAVWSFGEMTRWRLVPIAGLTAGVSQCSFSATGALGSLHESQLRPAVGALAGLEMALPTGRLGAEVRYIHSATSATGVLQNFELGGILFQVSWRFGL